MGQSPSAGGVGGLVPHTQKKIKKEKKMKRELNVTIGKREFAFETGVWAPQTNASVVLRSGKAVLLVTVVAGAENPEQDFFPLTVEYRERYAGAGHIPNAPGRREMRSTDAETLSSRLNDRSLRPLFPSAYKRETIVTIMAFSGDEDLDMPTAALNAASLALMMSDIPWDGPVVGLRIIRKNGEFIAFPTKEDCDEADMNFVISVSPEGIIMVEGGAQEVSEDELIECIDFAEATARPIIEMQRQFASEHGKEKLPITEAPADPEQLTELLEAVVPDVMRALHRGDKRDRNGEIDAIKQNLFAQIQKISEENSLPFSKSHWNEAFEHIVRNEARSMILSGHRFDDRRLDQVRPLQCEAHPLPSAHGSAFFARGLTQSLSTCTLGGVRDALRSENMFGSRTDNFFLHYNFPPYSVGEAKGQRAPGRREIGHGMLAQRALSAVIPPQSEFPYTIRLVSDILSSDGSSSMATVCAGCMALMDAGVPIKAPVTGIAMGLISEGGQHAILTDIVGDEDHLGDMDFKVCGTKNGVTALQMDLKIDGLPRETLREALEHAKRARHFILDFILQTIRAPRKSIADNAPKIEILRVRKAVIGDVIGAGGANIRALMEQTHTQIDIDDDGIVRISGIDPVDVYTAKNAIMAKNKRLAVGDIVQAYVLVVKAPFVRVELVPGTEAALHFRDFRNQTDDAFIEDKYRPGDIIAVRILGADDRGNIRIEQA